MCETSEKLHGSALYWSQLKATLFKNILLKKREKRKTIAEVFLPLYSLGILILIKLCIPNPSFPAMQTPSQQHASLFDDFRLWMNHSIAFAPNTSDVRLFLSRVDALWADYQRQHEIADKPVTNITWLGFKNSTELLRAYWMNPTHFPLAVLFDEGGSNPMEGALRYEIRTNPMFAETPSTSMLYSSPANCRFTSTLLLNQHISELFPVELGDTCPVNQYYYSGFIALQSLLDYAKMAVELRLRNLKMPSTRLAMFPKEAYTSRWIVAFRMIIPFYMVMSVSQFITYLLMLVVGEKETRIREAMQMMGLRGSVVWLGWIIIYAVFVLWLSITCCLLIYVLNVFRHTNMLLIFVLTFFYALSVIMFGFMLTPFFDKSRTAGILGNFAVNIMSVFYFLQIFVEDDSMGGMAFWLVSLLSSSGYALAMDKALVMDLKGEGISLGNMWEMNEGGIPFAGSIVMMMVDVLLYAALAIYFDCIIPGEHGRRRSPFFCLQPSFFCARKSSRTLDDTKLINNGSSTMSVNEETVDVEPVAREMKGREAITIAGLCKSFKVKGQRQAVNGIDLNIYEGQITAVLGHNGAGKTTLLNMLTGLTPPTSGTAFIFGYDIRNAGDMDRIRSMTGVCPQHDILFDCLTAREHLNFFAAVKGIHPEKRDEEVRKTLTDVDLLTCADVASRYLSGGQKRKLSVGIAVIGDPKIIILDEPTAGVDPQSRRHLWSLLRNRRHGKVILLTTHFMDEADILADRKAVVSKGKVRCCGSSLFLKNKFGIGYHLTLVLEGTCREHAIARLVMQHVPKAERARRHGRELSFILPHNAVEHFAALFAAIEHEVSARTHRLGISSFGVSMTTLEEVFLHLERDEETDESTENVENLSKKMVRNRALSRSLSLQSKASNSYHSLLDECANHNTVEDEAKNGDPTHGFNDSFMNIKCKPHKFEIFVALLKLRWLRLIRDIQKLYLMVLLPLALAALSLYGSSLQTSSPPQQASIRLSPELYANQSTILVFDETEFDMDVDTFFSEFGALGVHQVRVYDGNYSSLLQLKPNIGAINVRSFSRTAMTFGLIYNDTFTHSLPLLVNVMNNAVFRWLSKHNNASWLPIEASVRQLPQTRQPDGFNLGVVCTSLFVGMIFVLMPGNLAIDMVYDRQIRAKNQLRVNGLSFGMYFLSYFTLLATVVALIMSALFGIVLLVDIPALRNPPALIVLAGLVLLYCPASILYNTCLSYMFDKTDSAQALLPHIATSVGSVPFFLVVVLDMFRVGGAAPFVLHVVLSVFNPMYVPYAIIYYVQRVYLLCTINSACTRLTLHDYMTDEIVVLLLGTCFSIPVLSVVLLLLDALCTSGNIEEALKMLFNKHTHDMEDLEEEDMEEEEDMDVKSERRKVSELVKQQKTTTPPPVVVVQDLHKVYKDKVAIKSLSLAVDAGEVFGLLGHNGAGKTTTMKIITGEVMPTRGRVQIGGQSITSNQSEAFQLLGYCPQHDALWKNVSVREHMECYATIRGVQRQHRRRVIDAYLSGLQIDEHADKHASECSGGTRRKLSFALASIGAPQVVLMDEPSTGMDPRSKRFLWDTIIASFQGARGAILTTHSMEEADALCSRVGIMVQGELRCLGSTQHLKNLYGAGYTLEVKHGGSEEEPHERLKQFVDRLFTDARLVESFGDRFVFSVPQRSVTSLAACFSQLETAKQELNIVEYSFSQTTLEQVFLKLLSEEESEHAETIVA